MVQRAWVRERGVGTLNEARGISDEMRSESRGKYARLDGAKRQSATANATSGKDSDGRTVIFIVARTNPRGGTQTQHVLGQRSIRGESHGAQADDVCRGISVVGGSARMALSDARRHLCISSQWRHSGDNETTVPSALPGRDMWLRVFPAFLTVISFGIPDNSRGTKPEELA